MKPNLLNSIKLSRPKTNRFDLSHDVKMSLDMGILTPTLAMECVPGDRFSIGCDSLLRFAPMVAPAMHRFDVSMHYYFVPYRIIWPNWEKFITNTPIAGALPAVPYLVIKADGSNYTKLHDYMGIPRPDQGGGVADEKVSALPFAAYAKIYNDYYRDQNLQTDLLDAVTLEDGDNSSNGLIQSLFRRCWEHDYYTAALPFAQKGPAVDIPLGDVKLKEDWEVGRTDEWPQFVPAGMSEPYAGDLVSNTGLGGIIQVDDGNPAHNQPNAYDPQGSLETGATSINDLRRAFKLQEWLERNARGGTRYIENIFAHFGVKSSDKRLQRPEYITGTKAPVIVSEVLNTTGTEDAPQGTMAGHGVSVTQGKYGGYRCEEHGVIIGIMSVMPKTAYQQGIPKMFTKINDPFEHFWPSFAHLGEQEVRNQEVWAYSGATANTFGYVPRYAEYKFLQSRVAGDFRTSLAFWHLGRIFSGAPNLNSDFVSCNPGKRIFAVQDDNVDSLYAHVLHKITAIRSMPRFGTPSI